LVTNNDSWGVSCTGVFFYQECAAKLNNCIIYGNYHDPENPHSDTTQMWAWTFDGYGPEFRNCLVEGGLKYVHSPENVSVFEDILDTDPMFVDAANHDFRLAEGSPCIDAGNPKTPQYVLEGLDLNGNGRVKNNHIDIGPYEYSGAFVTEVNPVLFAKLVGNPLDKHSRIEFDEATEGEVTVTVYSLTGRSVVQKTIGLESSKSLGIGDLVERLTPGVYLIEIINKERSCTLKAVR